MLINNMVDAWKKRQVNGATTAEMPAQPAGTAVLDEVYLDAIVGGAADSIDVFTWFCTSSIPNTTVCRTTTTNLCA